MSHKQQVSGEDAKQLFMNRIVEGLCPVCGQALSQSTESVTDVNFGEISVCAHHMHKPKLGVELPKEDVKDDVR